MAYPILYASIVPGTVPSDYGLGVLAPISCTVEETRNGIYELEMVYPANGIHASEIATRRLLKAKPNFTDDPQLFRIYKVGKTLAGQFTVKARHISYGLNDLSITSGTAANIILAMQLLQASAPGYTFTTDKSNAGNFKITEPSSVRSWLAGKEGSILDVYGTGEYHFDNFNVQLKLHRGVTTPRTTIRYGKNLMQLSQELSSENLATSVQAYYKGSDGTVVLGTEISTGLTLDAPVKKLLDCSSEFQEAPSVADLDSITTTYISNNELTVPTNNITLDFAQIGQLKDRVDLCDMVNIYYEAYGITVSAKCIRTKWDCIEERYIETEFGDAKSGLSDVLSNGQAEIKKEITQSYKEAKAYTDAVKETLDEDIEDLQNQIDGNITTWYYDYAPALDNEPASEWTTDEEKEKHAGDLFFDNTTQFCYRWTYEDDAWTWTLIQDTGIAEALAAAQAAQDTADHKRRVFITTPIPPYDVGDLWTDQDNLYYCHTAKAEGENFENSDWGLAVDKVTASVMDAAIRNATELITGNLGGYVILHDSNGDGQPDELLIMDTDDIQTATRVWRWNQNGLGYSNQGYDPASFEIAITSQGEIVADFITTGTLSADLIKGGILQLGSNLNQNGTLQVFDEANSLIAQLDNNGLRMFGVDGFYIVVNTTDGFAGYDAQNNRLFWVNEDEFHQKKSVIEEEITLCNKLRFVPIEVYDENDNLVNDGIGLVSVV